LKRNGPSRPESPFADRASGPLSWLLFHKGELGL
jgi:hypothetical protein